MELFLLGVATVAALGFLATCVTAAFFDREGAGMAVMALAVIVGFLLLLGASLTTLVVAVDYLSTGYLPW